VSITINSQLTAGLRFSNASGAVSWQNNNRETKGAKVAEPKKEEAYWREQHAKQPYADKNLAYEHYATRRRNRTGIEAAQKYPGKPFEEIGDEGALDYERAKAGSALPWDRARAGHAAWAKLSGDVGPRDPDRGIRSGF
jgi:hypothetical protein